MMSHASSNVLHVHVHVHAHAMYICRVFVRYIVAMRVVDLVGRMCLHMHAVGLGLHRHTAELSRTPKAYTYALRLGRAVNDVKLTSGLNLKPPNFASFWGLAL